MRELAGPYAHSRQDQQHRPIAQLVSAAVERCSEHALGLLCGETNRQRGVLPLEHRGNRGFELTARHAAEHQIPEPSSQCSTWLLARVSVKTCSLLANKGGAPFRARHPLVTGDCRAVLRQEPPDKEAILAAGRGCKPHNLREMAIEIADPAVLFVGQRCLRQTLAVTS